jgi:hypothetical protein
MFHEMAISFKINSTKKIVVHLLKTKVYETNHQILITSALVVLIANFMTGVHVDGFTTALIVAIVLGVT